MGTSTAYRRRRAAALVLLFVAVFAVVLVVLHGCGGAAKRLAPAAGDSDSHYDPLAYDGGKQAQFERRAGVGLQQLLFEKSPGGAFASARRTEGWRPLIERATAGAGVDPELVESIVMLESAGRPDVIAGNDAAAAAGLSQILAGTATDLLGMHVDLGASRRLTKRIYSAQAAGRARVVKRLEAKRRRIDDRFNPPLAIAGTVRYLTLARKTLGRDDLAVESYHMGIGNLQTVLRRFGAGGDHPSYAEVYFDSTPLLHARAYRLLASFGDDSSTYLWRVYAARDILRLYRSAPRKLLDVETLHDVSDSAEVVLHPPRSTPAYTTAQAVAAALARRELAEPPARLAPLGLAFRVPPGPQRALAPAALAALVYIGAGTRDIAAGGRLAVTAATRPGRSIAASGYTTSGYEFDIARDYSSLRQALAFQFMLDRLQTLNLIAWKRVGDRIHVVAAGDDVRMLGDPAKLVRDALRKPS